MVAPRRPRADLGPQPPPIARDLGAEQKSGTLRYTLLTPCWPGSVGRSPRSSLLSGNPTLTYTVIGFTRGRHGFDVGRKT